MSESGAAEQKSMTDEGKSLKPAQESPPPPPPPEEQGKSRGGGCKPKCKLTFRRIRLLLWKNWIIRKRNFVCSLFELALPIIFVFIVFVLGTWLGILALLGRPTTDTKNGVTIEVPPLINYKLHGEANVWGMTPETPVPFLASEEEILQKTKDLLTKDPAIGPRTGRRILGYAPYTPLTEKIIQEAMIILGLSSASDTLYFENQAEIEELARNDFVLSKDEFTGAVSSSLAVAVIFEDGLELGGKWLTPSTDFRNGHTFSYKIRICEKEDKFAQGSIVAPPAPRETLTDRQFLYKTEIDSNNPIKKAVNHYVESGFAGLQIAIDKAIISLATKKPVTHKIKVQAFPHAAQLYADKRRPLTPHLMFNVLLPIFIFLGYIPIILFVTLKISDEKNTGIKELMKMSGLPSWMHRISWFITFLAPNLITATFIVIMLFIPFSPKHGAVVLFSESHMTLWWFVLVLFITATIAFGFFISSIFTNATVAVLIGAFAYIVPSSVVLFLAGLEHQWTTFALKMATSLIPTTALHWTISTLTQMQALGELHKLNKMTDPTLSSSSVGAKWQNLGVTVDDISIGYCILMLVIDTVLYTCLAIYFENIWPGDFGVRKPFYYIFLPPEWLTKRFHKKNQVAVLTEAELPERELGFEKEPELPAIVEVKELTKRYGRRKIAVNSISFKMFDGQITVLLGHNGAGKTTAMSMITGLISATSGTAFVNGMDMETDMDRIRQNVGLCPQQSMFFADLNVSEHLKFFALIKGRSFQEADDETTECLKRLRLSDKKTSTTKTLSGGQKRKLSFGMALIGDTKLLILDEPSSGMDPETRRAVWDLLLEIREGRAILLTTHFMEEADALGDRIIIMAEGEIKCCGSPMFLKQVYGAGYTLKFTMSPDANTEPILKVVQDHIPKAFVKDQKLPNATTLWLTIPTENDVNSIFPSLFTALSKKKTDLGILTMSMQVTTMDEVFLRVGELSIKDEHGKTVTALKELHDQRDLRKLTGCKLWSQQMYAVLVKRIIFMTRIPLLLIAQLIFPLMMLYPAIAVFTVFYNKEGLKPPLEIELSQYSRPVSYYSYVDKDFGSAYSKSVGPSAEKVKNLQAAVLEVCTKEDRWGYKHRFRYVIGAAETKESITAMFSPYALHSCPLSINAVTNGIAGKLGQKKTYKINVVNHPLKAVSQNKNNFDFLEAIGGSIGPMLFGLFFNIGVLFFGAVFILYPVTENVCGSKQLQLMTGVNPAIFWGTSMFLDNIVVWIMDGLLIVGWKLYTMGGTVTFSVDGGLAVFFIVFAVYGFGAVAYAYMWHGGPSSVRGGFIFLCLMPLVIDSQLILAYQTLPSIGLMYKITALKYVGMVFEIILILFLPSFAIVSFTKRFVILAKDHDTCRQRSYGIDNHCIPGPGSTPIPECCINCHEFELPKGVYCLRNSYFTMMRDHMWGDKIEKDLGIGIILLFTIVAAIMYTAIFFYLEYRPAGKQKLKVLVEKEEVGGRLNPQLQAQYLHNQAVFSSGAQSLAMMPDGQVTASGAQTPGQYPTAIGVTLPQPQVPSNTALAPSAQPGAYDQAVSLYPTATVQVMNFLPAPAMYQNYSQPPANMAPTNPYSGQPRDSNAEDANSDTELNLEEDVLAERKRIRKLVADARTDEDALVVHKLTKLYGSFDAVSDLTFGVHHGECFGLLGVNGAGKTTAFRMLSGDERVTSGAAYTRNFSLIKHPRSFLENIGYCPQSDSFLKMFTGKQMLELYSRLRGIAGSASVEADRWLTIFGLSDAKNEQCQYYSGGMKRRLNAAIAMIGDPPLILFDEPTSGVDPIAQHLFWDIILSMRGSEQSVILTSHSMAECEALCSRLGIMVNGQFQCFGGAEHLKNKYGEGFSLFIKLKPSLDPEIVNGLKAAVEDAFNPCVLKDEHLNILQYQVLNAAMTYGEIFQATENLKSKFSNSIEEYSVNDSTLEEVFLTFARKQYGNREAGRQKFTCKKLMFCECDCCNGTGGGCGRRRAKVKET